MDHAPLPQPPSAGALGTATSSSTRGRPRPARRRAGALRLLAWMLLAALLGWGWAQRNAIQEGAAALPLLPPGLTLGTTLYGAADLDALGDGARDRLDEAVARGLNGFSYYVDWFDLEPEPGRYTLERFTATLDALQELGLTPFVNLTVIDTGDYNLPAGLSGGAAGIAAGVSLDDPAVLARFGALLERVVPILVARGGFHLGLGNEVDVRFDDEGDEGLDGYVRFVAAARERVHALEPRLSVGVTLTAGAVRNASPTFLALREVSDVVPVNYGPVGSDFLVMPTERITTDFRELLDAYGDGPVLIQELTCPSAAAMGSSVVWQRDCYARLFAEIERRPEIRFASLFTLQDFDAETCRFVRDALFGDELTELPPAIAKRLTDYLCHLGLLMPDGTPKPAWGVLLDAVAANAD